MADETLILDGDYTLFYPGFTGLAKIVYRILGVAPKAREEIIKRAESLFGGSLEHLMISLLCHINLGNPTQIVVPETLDEARRTRYKKCGVYSIRPESAIARDVERLGYVVDAVVGPKISLRSFIKPSSLTEDCLVRCMEKLEAVKTLHVLQCLK